MPDLPPIVKLAERLMVDIENAVTRFPRRHKYMLGTQLREQALEVVRLGLRAWRDKPHQIYWTKKLVWAIDDLKISLQVGKAAQAFGSFAEFEALARVASDLGRQSGGWQKQQMHRKGQNSNPRGDRERAQILSTGDASVVEANP